MANNLDLSATLKLIDDITGPLRGIQSQVSRSVQSFNDARDAVKKLEATQNRITAFKDMSRELTETSGKLQTAKQRMEALRQQIAATNNPSQTLINRFNAAQRSVERLDRSVDGQRQSLAQLRQRLESAGISTSNLGRDQSRLADQIAEANRRLDQQRERMNRVRLAQERWQNQQQRWQSAGAGATVVATAGALALTVPIKDFSEAEDAAMSLKVSMMDSTGAVSAEFAKINALAERLGTSLPGSTAEFSSMMAKLIQQGISAEKILGGVGEASANLAVVMKMPFDEAAEFAAKMQDATKTSAEDMLELMDTIQKSYYLGVDSTNMLSGFSKLSSGMKTIRMEGLEGAKAMAPFLIMADQAAMAGESAGNAYSKIFKGMLDTSKIAKALDGTGISLEFTDGKGEFANIDKMYAQLDKLKPLSTEQRNSLIGDIWGNDAETIQALNLIIDKGQAGYKETIAKMDAQADLQKRVNAQLSTLANIWDAAKGTFTSAMVNFGEALAPDLKIALDWMRELAEGVGSWAKENPELARTIMRIASVVVIAAAGLAVLSIVMLGILGPIALLSTSFATLGGFAGIFSSLLAPLKMLWALFGFVGQAVVSAVALIGKSLMFLLNTIRVVGMAMMANPILIAITLLAVAAFLIWKNWGPIKEFFIGLWASISAGAQALWISITTIWQGIVTSVTTWAMNLWTQLQALFSAGIEALKFVIMNFTPVGLFIQAFAAVWTYLSGLGTIFYSYGANLLQGLRDGIMSRAAAVVEGIQGVAGRIKGAFTGLMGIRSPSRVFAGYGDFMMQGLNNGLLKNDSPVQAMLQTSNSLRDAMDTSEIRFDSRKPISASAMMGGATGSQNQAPIINTFNIYAQPGQSEQQIAQLVADTLAKQQRSQNNNNTALYDLAEQW